MREREEEKTERELEERKILWELHTDRGEKMKKGEKRRKNEQENMIEGQKKEKKDSEK